MTDANNRVLIWPLGMEAEAAAYVAWATPRNPDLANDASARWCDTPIPTDKFGRCVVNFLGPGALHGAVTEEPEGGEPLRAGAELSDTVEWQDED